MIRCPKCGTVNADGSRFCSNCGFRLPQTRVRCPVCGAYNPVSNLFCEKCHARLVPPGKEESEPGVEDLLSLPIRPPDDVPDWLRGLLDEHGTAELSPDSLIGTAAEDVVPSPEELPEWLANLAPVGEEEAPVEEGAPAEAEAVPDWLADLAPAGEEAPVEEESPAEAEAVPDWLADLASAEEETPVEEEPPAEAETIGDEEALPSSLPGEALVEEGAEGEEEGEEDEEEGEIAPAIPSAGTGEEIPDWLKNLDQSDGGATEADKKLAAGAVPDWLLRIKPSGTGALPPLDEALGERAEAEGGPARAEIPEWLQKLRPSGGETETPPPFAPGAAVSEGPLEGLAGVIPPAMTVDMHAAYARREPESISPALQEAARLWQSILERPRDRQRPVAAGRRRSEWSDALIRIATAIVLVAVILAAIFDFVPPVLFGEGEGVGAGGVAPLVQTVSALHPEDVVIVAFEYGASQQGEMEPMTYALVEHLMERQVRLVGISTSAQGASLAEMTLAQARRRYPEFADKVANAGYIPGGATAVSRFLASPQAREAKLLVVFAADAEHLRWWLEQNAAGPDLPLVVALNSATAPLVSPYLESRQVIGWMSGLEGARAYWQERGLDLDESLVRRVQALQLSRWMVAALVLAGSAYYLFAGRRKTS